MVVQANKIQDKNSDVPDLIGGYSSGKYSSIQALENNKYLVGTHNNGFWLLVFNDDGLVVQANKIKKLEKITDDEFDGFYEENKEKFEKEYKELETLSNFESDDDKIFWKEFVMKMFVIDEENKEWKIVDDYLFSNKEIWTEEKLEKFKEWLVEEKDNSWKRWLWFLTIIPIVPIVIFLFIYFIKKSKNK